MSDTRPVHIVVVEDNTPDVLLIGESLREQGIEYTLTHLSDGAEALKRLTGATEPLACDIIVLDLNMPRVGGLEVLAKLQADGRYRDVPILVLTSSLAPEEQREASLLGATRYLKKPVDLQQFFSDVGNVVHEMITDSKVMSRAARRNV